MTDYTVLARSKMQNWLLHRILEWDQKN